MSIKGFGEWTYYSFMLSKCDGVFKFLNLIGQKTLKVLFNGRSDRTTDYKSNHIFIIIHFIIKQTTLAV